MPPPRPSRGPIRVPCQRTILHFDYDCFYASVFEAENPALKTVPLAVQQKQIIVTCNYEARRRGLYKLQLIAEARKVCPDVVIVLGEDLTRFRNASKALYGFLGGLVWSGRCERLGFDEVWLDVSDMVEHNVQLLNRHDLANSFFCMDRQDPTSGFPFDASSIIGNTYPDGAADGRLSNLPEMGRECSSAGTMSADLLDLRLRVASHLARYLRRRLEGEKGYTATVGVSVNKLLSKLVGNVVKPCAQTTLLPPYNAEPGRDDSNVTKFMDEHDIGKIPGIGFKLSQKIRRHVLGREPQFSDGLVYGGTKESVLVRDVRYCPNLDAETLEGMLGGPGSQKGIGGKVYELIHGVDDSEVGRTKMVPTQISIEDSYLCLDTLEQAEAELLKLSISLLTRMHLDLTETDPASLSSPGAQSPGRTGQTPSRHWLAIPRTLRISTRPRPPPNPDGSRARTSNRISRSAPLPSFALADDDVETLAPRLATETLLPAFKRLHPERAGWNLSLVNVAVTNMMLTAGDDRGAGGRDIGKMFRQQRDVLREFTVVEDKATSADAPARSEREVSMVDDRQESLDVSSDGEVRGLHNVSEDCASRWADVGHCSEGRFGSTQGSVEPGDWTWENEEEEGPGSREACELCGAPMPAFAMDAHLRFHMDPD